MAIKFPDFDAWCRDVLHPDDTKWWNFRTKYWHAYYHNKARIAAAFKPERILEIGVRFGYSAHAFLCGSPYAYYVGIDGDDPKYGGWDAPMLDWAKDMLERTHPASFSPALVKADSNEFLFSDTNSQFGFTHIDGDHSYEGCLRDLRKFWPHTTRAMLVDDYDECCGVQDAVRHFVEESGALKFYMPSLRGEALLLK